MTTQLTEAALEGFATDGFVVVEDLFDPATDFAPLVDEWSEVLSRVASDLIATGALGTSYEKLPFDQRLIAISAESGKSVAQAFDISLPQKNIALDTPMHLGDAVFRIISHARLLDVVEALLGPEIVSNPVQHVRMKLPDRARPDGAGADYLTGRVSWHQDLGVLAEEADAATILSCWIAVTDATVENGCLQVIPGSHRRDLIDHCPTGHDLGIPDRFLHLSDATPLPLRAGSALIFGQQLVHGSLDNTTGDQVRISIDLRYQPPGQPSGRPDFPSFLVRGAGTHGYDEVLDDPAEWRQLWADAQRRLSQQETPRFNRWDADSPLCA